MDLLLILLVLGLVVWLVAAPLRHGHAAGEQRAESAEAAELEAQKEAKYREIRDAELDHRTGKLSDADWRELDRRLRREALDLLRRLDDIDAAGRGERLP